MKPTDEERREVAAKLREMARQYGEEWGVVRCSELPAPVDDAMHVCDIDRAVYASEIFNRLADLIEPGPERTCRMEVYTDTIQAFDHDEQVDLYECGGCGSCLAFVGEEESIPNYCPSCGAKVVDQR